MLKLFSKSTGLAAVAAMAFFALQGAHAHEETKGALIVDHAWSRASIGTARPGIAYMTILNSGKTADALIGAETPVAAQVHIHETRREGGVMRMAPLEKITIPADGRAVLEPGGAHLMLMGLKKQLEVGDTFPITLIFEKAGRLTMDVYIENAGAGAPKPAPMKGMDHNMGHGMGSGGH